MSMRSSADATPADQVYEALHYRFTVDIEAASLPGARELLSGLTSDDQTSPSEVLRLGRTATIESLLGTIALRAIDRSEGGLLVHSGALAVGSSGREVWALLLVGPSGSGKSTLTAELVRRGYGYLTDETVHLDPATLELAAFRKPLSLKPGSDQLFPEIADLQPTTDEGRLVTLVPPNKLGGRRAPPSCLTPRVAIFPTYDPARPPSCSPLTPARTAYEIGRNTAKLRQIVGGAVAALEQIGRHVRGYRLIYDDLSSAADVVERLTEGVDS
jgi:hypothetical protein